MDDLRSIDGLHTLRVAALDAHERDHRRGDRLHEASLTDGSAGRESATTNQAGRCPPYGLLPGSAFS
jgi:hypothetical protein